MQQFLMGFQVVLSILLSLAILLQQKGAGLSATFGGGGGFIASKRGAEKFLSNATIVLATLFVLNAAAFLFL
ncbi:preprotein translocase subunit SecG [Candidatus Gracilibacteria bacterium]|nr:preprotein translocase subunit SecG [Candidatus Gracilibacteria bacterium]